MSTSEKTVRSRRSAALPPAGVILIALLVLAPLVSILALATGDAKGVWGHLIVNVLPRSIGETLWLMAGVGLFSAAIGAGAAWLVARYEFPGRAFLHWALVLPLAIPTYISAYCFLEILDFTGPLQTAIRSLFGFTRASEYWFPDIRSTQGGVFVMTAVLYPYVYLTCRLLFEMQGANVIEVGRVLGASGMRLFFRVALPMARPAMAAGVALALMETLNDIGAVEILGVRTLTFSVFDTWLNRSSLAGAAQISLLLLVVVALLLWVEMRSRGGRGYASRNAGAGLTRIRLTGLQAAAATFLCALPPAIGFAAPVALMVDRAARRLEQFADPSLLAAVLNSVTVSIGAATFAVLLGLALAALARRSKAPATGILTRLSTLGYAVPGSVLAIGTLFAASTIDNSLDAVARSQFGFSTGLLITGSAAIIVYAATVRYLAVAHGAIDAGFTRISPHVGMVARTLGRTANQTLAEVELPLLRRALATAALLVFVDTMKELSATLLLRPFNFSTLATRVYELASRALFDDAAAAALLIVAIGVVPVIALSGMQAAGMASRQKK